MALREILSVLQSNIDYVATATGATWGDGIHAGSALARLTASGTAVPAYRGISGVYVGVAADDAVPTKNTMVQVDPVGATGLDSSGNVIAENNGYFSAWKRAIGDFQNETVRNLNNLTDVTTDGYSKTARRGIGYYATASTQLIIDTIISKLASATNADGGTWNATWLTTNQYLSEAAATGDAGYFVVNATAALGTQRLRVDKVFGAGANTAAGVDSKATNLCQVTML